MPDYSSEAEAASPSTGLTEAVRTVLQDRLGSGTLDAVRALMAVNAAEAADMARIQDDPRIMLVAQSQLSTLLGKILGEGGEIGGDEDLAGVVGSGPVVRDRSES